jgi:signal transduction histidine kinase/HD-like signal output (HDOD) protein
MSSSTVPSSPSIADRLDRLLEEFDTLPTLGVVAIRLLQLTSDEDAEAREIIRLVASDPALSSKVLALCRCRDRSRTGMVTTIDRAVLALGFDAVRSAVLSAQVFEAIDGMWSPGGEAVRPSGFFDRETFWLHCLGVAVASEMIAACGRGPHAGVKPDEAFMAGLLHDIGQLILHVLLPESFDRVCQFVETHGAPLDRTCRQLIGIDTHTVGKRLAERWGMPPSLVDVIWLNGQPRAALPSVPHRNLIEVVTLADAIVRHRYVAPTVHSTLTDDVTTMCEAVGVAHADIERIGQALHSEVADRADALGLNLSSEPAILLRALTRANVSLARANAGMRQRDRLAHRRNHALRAVERFYTSLPDVASTHDGLTEIVRSAASVLERPVPAALFRIHAGEDWNAIFFTADGRPFGRCPATPPPDGISPSAVLNDMRPGAPVLELMPWLGALFAPAPPPADLRALPLGTADAPGSAILLVDGEPATWDATTGILRCWEAALTAGAQHDAISRLVEEIAQANRTLVETQTALAQSQMMATLGEVAAGAAHEMNNPLMLISGRSQLLAHRLKGDDDRRMALEIDEQSHRLSDMITALRSFAEPIAVSIKPADLAALIADVVGAVRTDAGPKIEVVPGEATPHVRLDAGLIGPALRELLTNAIEAEGVTHIAVCVQTDPLDGRLRIEVRDDGTGLSDHALRHAFDPFFSEKPAGRQPGLGLARTRRAVTAHGGEVTLVNAPGGGTTATIWLRDERADDDEKTLAQPGGTG